jgi:hypothetical protein
MKRRPDRAIAQKMCAKEVTSSSCWHGGVRVDRAVAAAIVEAVSRHAIEAAIHAAERMSQADADLRNAGRRELEEARYEATRRARVYAPA